MLIFHSQSKVQLLYGEGRQIVELKSKLDHEYCLSGGVIYLCENENLIRNVVYK